MKQVPVLHLVQRPDENYEDDEHDYHRCTHDKTLLYTIFRLIRI